MALQLNSEEPTSMVLNKLLQRITSLDAQDPRNTSQQSGHNLTGEQVNSLSRLHAMHMARVGLGPASRFSNFDTDKLSRLEKTFFSIEPFAIGVFEELGQEEVMQLALTCHFLYNFIYSHPTLWRTFDQRIFTPHRLYELEKNFMNNGISRGRAKIFWEICLDFCLNLTINSPNSPSGGRNLLIFGTAANTQKTFLNIRRLAESAYPRKMVITDGWLDHAMFNQRLMTFLKSGRLQSLEVWSLGNSDSLFLSASGLYDFIHRARATDKFPFGLKTLDVYITFDKGFDNQHSVFRQGIEGLIMICEPNEIKLNIGFCTYNQSRVCGIKGQPPQIGYRAERVCEKCEKVVDAIICFSCDFARRCYNCYAFHCLECPPTSRIWPQVDGPFYPHCPILDTNCARCKTIIENIEHPACSACKRATYNQKLYTPPCFQCGKWICASHAYPYKELQCHECFNRLCPTCCSSSPNTLTSRMSLKKLMEEMTDENKPALQIHHLYERATSQKMLKGECPACEQWHCQECLPKCTCDSVDGDECAIHCDNPNESCWLCGQWILYVKGIFESDSDDETTASMLEEMVDETLSEENSAVITYETI